MKARFTKKYMSEDYERLYDHASLLDLYLFDTQTGAKPDAMEHYRDKNSDAKMQLWRAKGAAGGYVVVMGNTPNIWYLDEAISTYRDNHSEYTVAIRICLERLAIARNRIYSDSLGRPLMELEQINLGQAPCFVPVAAQRNI